MKNMFVSDCYNVNEKGHLTISGCDTVELAEKYGTALYVMSEDEIRSVCRRYKSSFERHYNGKGTALYASKAFCCKEICRIVTEERLRPRRRLRRQSCIPPLQRVWMQNTFISMATIKQCRNSAMRLKAA